MLDLGTGAFAKLQLAIEYTKVDTIVISHVHADHFFDLVPLCYALRYGQPVPDRRIAVWLPPGGLAAVEALRRAVAVDAPSDFFDSVYSLREYDPGRALQLKDLRLEFARTRHYVVAFAIRAHCDGAVLTYSADTAPCDDVVELAQNSALFLCEAALGLNTEEGERGHSSAQEAGIMAAHAGVKRLVLTHYPARVSPDMLVAAARRSYEGEVETADDGLGWEL